VTEVPEQIVDAEGLLVMLTVGVAVEFTVMVITLLEAVAGVAHANEEVIRQVTVCPFVNVEFVYTALFVPTGELFTNH
jgi:hypothetical protein